MRFDRWTAEQEQMARDLRARHAPASDYLTQIGRSKASAFSRIYAVDQKERQTALRNIRIQKLREERGASNGKHQVISPKHVPEDVFLEAQRRRAAPQTLTGFVFGDPPIGYRAIDRKREQESA
jgi:hypothetical protein